MDINIRGFDGVHLLGDSATHSPAPRSPRHAALLVLCRHEPAASSRLAWHADHGTGECVQLPFPG
ncbi:MAG: hypothetical protein LBQ32_03750 [Burkholderiaceae bacterium]|nr:hypothetical protein [Burkholderiaceae bacterium]